MMYYQHRYFYLYHQDHDMLDAEIHSNPSHDVSTCAYCSLARALLILGIKQLHAETRQIKIYQRFLGKIFSEKFRLSTGMRTE